MTKTDKGHGNGVNKQSHTVAIGKTEILFNENDYFEHCCL